MSSCVVLNNGEFVIMASDTALSSLENDVFKRVGNSCQKIFHFGNSLLFISGRFDVVELILSYIKKENTISPIFVSKLLSSLNIEKEDGIFSVEIILVKSENKNISVYQISQYNDYKIVELDNDFVDSLSIHCAGIKSKECTSILQEELKLSRNAVDVLKKTYSKLSCETIGGFLDIWVVTKSEIKFLEKINIDVPPKNLHMLVADVIVGRLLAGNTLTITNSNNNFTLDSTGATLNNAKFNIQTTNTKVIIDPTSSISFRIQKNQGGTFVDKFWVDNSGNVNFSGTLSGANGTFSGTLIATTGYIGTMIIDSLGLITLDGQNYLRGNGDLKWGGLSILGGTATFSGTIYADKIVGQVVNSQISNGAVDDSKVTSGLDAGKITNGTMSGSRIYGGSPTFSGVQVLGTDLGIQGNLTVVGSLLSEGTITTNEGYFYTNLGYIVAGSVGVTTSRSISTPFGSKIITFKGGICIGFT